MKIGIFSSAVLFLAILFPARLSAQTSPPVDKTADSQKQSATSTVPVAGVVRTKPGVPVPGATVRLTHLPTGQAWVTWTDENGKFVLQEMPAGRYRIEAQLLGFARTSVEAEVASNAPTDTELALSVALSGDDAEVAGAEPESGKASGEEVENSAPAAPPAVETAANTQPAKNHHRHHADQIAADGSPANGNAAVAGGTNATSTSASTSVSASTSSGATPSAPARKAHHRSFKQVDTTDPSNADETDQQPSSLEDPTPLGAASSSDAFLMNGTVARGSTNSLTPLGTQDPGTNPNEAASDNGAQKGSGHRHTHKGQAQALTTAQPEGFGQGIEQLAVADRVSRASSNRVRFGFYDKYGNSVWNARPYGINAPNPTKLSAHDNQFGIHLGGPFSIPGIYRGRDRTFLFASYELGRQLAPTDQVSTVPTAAERQGDFSGLGIQLFDPQSSLSGPRALLGNGSVIPEVRLDPSAQKFLPYIPLPNLPGTVENFHLQELLPLDSDRVNVRLMHTFSPKLSLQAYYYLSSMRLDSSNNFPAFNSHESVRGQNLTVSLTQNLTDRLIHDTRINWNRFRDRVLDNFAFKDNIAAQLGVSGVSNAPIDFGVPQITYLNFNPLGDPTPNLTRNQTFRFIDSLSYARSRHTFRTGVEIRRMQRNSITDPTPRGAFDFSGVMTGQLDVHGNPVSGTGFDFADFLLGLPDSTTLRYGSPSTYFRNWGYITYAQDDWRIHPRLTFDYGVRFEVLTPPIELYNHISNLDINPDQSQIATVVPGQVGPFSGQLPRSLIRGHHNHWAPRLGLAWRPTDRLPVVVRAGYSIFYNESVYTQISSELFDQPPWGITQARLTSSSRLLTLENGFSAEQLPAVRNTTAVDPNYRVANAQVWNLSLETRLPGNWLTEFTYTGTKGTHLDLLTAPNQPAPGSVLTQEQQRRIQDAGGFVYDTSGASSIFHALQVRVQRHLAHGFMLRGLYTYGKSIDNASSIGGGAAVVVQDPKNLRADRGLSTFDVRHQFVAFYSYELPFGGRHRWLRTGRPAAIFGNLHFSGDTTLATGTPFTARVSTPFGESVGTGLAGGSERADQIGNPTLPSGQRSVLHWFNTAAFVVPPPGRFGDSSRNAIPGPGTIVFNLALTRRMHFGIDGKYRLDMRWEVQNLMNHPNFRRLDSVVDSDTYGSVISVQGMRTMVVSMRVHF
jgi:hypothetical protein